MFTPITVHVPEEQVTEFYIRFGDFLLGQGGNHATAGAQAGTQKREAVLPRPNKVGVPDWVTEPGALDRAIQMWDGASPRARDLLSVLIERATKAPNEKVQAEVLAELINDPGGVSSISGILGALGRLANKIGIPRYRTGEGGDWHYIWDWDHKSREYWMSPEVAALFTDARNA